MPFDMLHLVARENELSCSPCLPTPVASQVTLDTILTGTVVPPVTLLPTSPPAAVAAADISELHRASSSNKYSPSLTECILIFTHDMLAHLRAHFIAALDTSIA